MSRDLNSLIEDKKAIETNYGKHERVVVFSPEYNGCHCRIDYRYGLKTPTEKDIIRVMKKGLEKIQGKWKIINRIMWSGGRSEDIYLERV